MNRKIFTLLACTLMLFSTAFYVNAQRNVAEKSVGDVVTTLPGSGPGMYHIQIDSICLPDTVVYSGSGGVYPSYHPRNGQSLTGELIWIPATYDGGSVSTRYFQYVNTVTSATALADRYEYADNLGPTHLDDTMFLSVTGDGRIAMVSASNLRDSLASGGAKLQDLQATMWCVDVVDAPNYSEWPTFHFTNKVYSMDLDWEKEGETRVRGYNQGWMYSHSYLNNLQNKTPFYRHDENLTGIYRVITAELDPTTRRPTGFLETKSVGVDQYLKDTIAGLIKFSIMKIAPVVMTAEDFNTQMGNTDGSDKVTLSFNPTPNLPHAFAYGLHALPSGNATAESLGYLNIQAYDGNTFKGYVANSNQLKADDSEKYENLNGTEYLNILATNEADDKSVLSSDNGDYNYSYRFVYFPSADSIVINAYYVKHDGNNDFDYNSYMDDIINDPYTYDRGGPSRYYGLYNDTINDHLIVRLQDLTGNVDHRLLTIGKHPANVRIYLGVTCEEEVEAWQVPEGVYTIWDTRGRCLGVRIYNGSYSPQWLELEAGECPDRIPSYQWVVEHPTSSKQRINIHNREFGNLAPEDMDSFVNIRDVLVKRGSHQIFKHKYQFLYDPILMNPQYKYEPIVDSYVAGALIPARRDASECRIKEESGFRPVMNVYVTDQYLGYKHFHVDNDPTSVGFGKSEDVGTEKGMDYNAFAFNYLYYDTELGYIDSKSEYNDSILHISTTKKTGFQFMLGTNLRSYGHQEELFGYPRTAWSKRTIADGNYSYDQDEIPVLKRYYYELKVADFYNYRDDLAEEYVVLKGAKSNVSSDQRNKLKYGLVNKLDAQQPYKFANVYLRESYFLERPQTLNEERNKNDDTRRIFYALLDRVEAEQLKNVVEDGFEVSDTLWGGDGTSKYNLLSIKVEDALPNFLKAQGKTVSTARASVFALENINYPLYRRLRSVRDDKADLSTPGALDAPKVLRIYRHVDKGHFLHEDALSDAAYNYGINFLGFSNIAQNPEVIAPDGTVKYNYNLFIDTAYINRGTGEIKPQYLIAVAPDIVSDTTLKHGSDACGEPLPETKIIPYVIARYLVNATDSARVLGSNAADKVEARDKKYIYDGSWDRLAFVPAIHADDRLYIISEMEKRGVTADLYTVVGENGKTYVRADVLRKMTEPGGLLYGTERTPRNSLMYGAYYDFGTWDNYHNDVCFSLRFVKPNVQNPDENGDDAPGISNEDKRFLIESETTNRTATGNKKIAPVQGGWIKLQNFVPVLSRTSYDDAIANAEIFNVAWPNVDWQDGKATSNEEVAGKICVVAGTDEIVILNAAGKQVTLTNLLGQTLVNKALNGNNEKISVAKGLVIVNVEGEKAVKAIVK